MAKTRNSFGIPFFTQGPEILVARLNAILSALDAVRAQRSQDIDPLVTPEGTLYTVRNPQGSSSRLHLPSEPKTFFCTPADELDPETGEVTTNRISVTAGVMGTQIFYLEVIDVEDADIVCIEATVTTGGFCTAVGVTHAAAVPDNTATVGYKPIALISFDVDGKTVVTPLSWNWAEVGLCAGLFQWGGFGA